MQIALLLEGKTALITGAGQGNGRAMAIGLAQAGARVIVTDLNPDTASQTAQLIEQTGAQAQAHALDVGDAAACQALFQTLGLSALDVLVNNAGIIGREGIDGPTALQTFQRVIRVNLEGTVNMCHAGLSALRKSRGCIVNIASVASYAGQPGSLGYAPSKGGVKLLTQSLAAELARDGVRVNAIAPGLMDTPMIDFTRHNPQRLEGFIQRIPMARMGRPDELVGALLFLASDMSSYVTGAIVPVDGGLLAV